MRSDLLILLGGMALLAVLNVVFLAVILATLRKVSQISAWPSTQGVVMGSSVEQARRRAEDEGPVDYPVVKYSYQVGGQAFQGSRIAPGPELSGPGARQVAARYATGASVTVFYNPQNPADAVLERNAPAKNWLWFILVVFDCVICGAAPLAWWGLSQ